MKALKHVRVLGDSVLVKQTMTIKTGKIILSEVTPDEDKYTFDFEVVAVGNKCERDIRVGDKPVFEKHVQFNPVRLLENTNQLRSSLLTVHENSIVAIDNTPDLEIAN